MLFSPIETKQYWCMICCGGCVNTYFETAAAAAAAFAAHTTNHHEAILLSPGLHKLPESSFMVGLTPTSKTSNDGTSG